MQQKNYRTPLECKVPFERIRWMNRLKEYREKRKITQEKLAELSGVSQGMISAHERGDKHFSDPGKIAALAKVLDCNASEIIEPNLKFSPQIILSIMRAHLTRDMSDRKKARRIEQYLNLIEEELSD